MQFKVIFLLLFGLLSTTYSAPREGLPLLTPGGIGGIFEGINSETIIRGPDGSEITSEQKGGAVIRDDGLSSQPIIAAESELLNNAQILNEEPILSARPIIASTGAPILASVNQVIASSGSLLASPSTPLLTGETYAASVEDIIAESERVPVAIPEVAILPSAKPIEIVQQDPHIIEAEIIDVPEVESDQSSDLKGASGRIITKGSASIVSGPASTTITEPRKIIVTPPKLALAVPLQEVATPLPLALPDLSVPSIASLVARSDEGGSTLVPPILSYSSTVAPAENGYSTISTPLEAASLTGSTRIDLGVNDLRQSIPVVEYSSSNGVIDNRNLINAGTYSSTEAPILSSTIGTLAIDPLSLGPATPAASLASQGRLDLVSVSQNAGLTASTISTNVQKIPRIEDSIAVDGRVDIGYPSYRTLNSKNYHLPQVLEMALSRFYQKTPVKEKDLVTIDDKMGDLSQNEIVSYDTRQQSVARPDLSQSEYLAPTLARNGIDPSQIDLASIPLSQVTRLADGAYHLENRYEGNTKRRRSN